MTEQNLVNVYLEELDKLVELIRKQGRFVYAGYFNPIRNDEHTNRVTGFDPNCRCAVGLLYRKDVDSLIGGFQMSVLDMFFENERAILDLIMNNGQLEALFGYDMFKHGKYSDYREFLNIVQQANDRNALKDPVCFAERRKAFPVRESQPDIENLSFETALKDFQEMAENHIKTFYGE